MHKHRDDDLLIPESVAVRVANKVLGTAFSAVQEIAVYLDAHPEKRKLFEKAIRGALSSEVQIGNRQQNEDQKE